MLDTRFAVISCGKRRVIILLGEHHRVVFFCRGEKKKGHEGVTRVSYCIAFHDAPRDELMGGEKKKTRPAAENSSRRIQK